MKKKTIFTLILFTLITFMFTTISIADVGSFEDYGSSWDSDWGSSSWDSDWGSSSWDSDYSSGSFFFFGDSIGFFIFIIIVVIVLLVNKNKNTNRKNDVFYNRTPNTMQSMHQLEARQTQIENKIQAHDPNFNKEELISWSKNLFVKLQQAWTKRDWEALRAFETESLFEQHKNQLQGYIDNHQINVMDRICVNYAHLYAYRQEGDKEILTVRLNSRMKDYIIDDRTNAVLRGDKETERVNTYLLTFIRKNGVKTKEGTLELNTTNCPNCGAPTKITSAGKCEYCGSVITIGEYNWVLSNLQRENVR